MRMRKILNLRNGTCFSRGQVGHILNSGHKHVVSWANFTNQKTLLKSFSRLFPPNKKLAKFHMFQPLDLPTINPLNGWPSFHAIQPCCLCGTLQSTSCRHLLVVANLRHWIKERKLITTINVAVAIRLNVEVQARDHMITTLTLSKHTFL